MNNNSFTDEQLLNLVNNTILQDTDFAINDFTGGSIQSSVTGHGNLKYKIHLFFGYDKNRNTITFSKDVKDVLYDIWSKAIRKKTESVHSDSVSNLFSDINSLMQNDAVKKSCVKEIGRGKGRGSGIGSSPLRNEMRTNSVTKEVIDYLNDKLGTKYRSNGVKTMGLVKSRVADGFNLDDFKLVIDTKCTAWGRDKKMAQYLRPETLFGNKFEGYLNEISGSTLKIVNTEYDKEDTI